LVTAEEAIARVTAGAVLVDVRSAEGRAAAGELEGATVVAKSDVGRRFSLVSPDLIAAVTGPDTPIVVVCGSVRGSGPVAAELRGLGFTQVVHVEGGFPALRESRLHESGLAVRSPG
jgi:rhodanese-related sulfurtransferase